MTDYPIDKGVAMPPAREFRNGPKYPWEECTEIGDSFYVSGAKPKVMASVAYTAGKRLGMKFTVRAEADGVRVWRVA